MFSFPNNQNLMISISTILDPRYVFLIYAPVLFALNKAVGQRMILALTSAEWLNQILKWLLAGERPYWYVHDRATQLEASLNATGIESYDMAALLTGKQFEPLAQLRQFQSLASWVLEVHPAMLWSQQLSGTSSSTPT